MAENINDSKKLVSTSNLDRFARKLDERIQEDMSAIIDVVEQINDLTISLEEEIKNKQDKADENLNTTAKEIVNAINELELESFETKAELIYLKENSLQGVDVDALKSDNLNTVDKTIVGAINEVNESIENLDDDVSGKLNKSSLWYAFDDVEIVKTDYTSYLPSKETIPNENNYLLLNTNLNLVEGDYYKIHHQMQVVGDNFPVPIIAVGPLLAKKNKNDILFLELKISDYTIITYDNCTYQDNELIKNDGTSVIMINSASSYILKSFSVSTTNLKLLNGKTIENAGIRFTTAEEKETWNNKADKSELFSGSYNDLTDKPEIPSIEGLATEEYVEQQIGDISNQLANKADKMVYTYRKKEFNKIVSTTTTYPKSDYEFEGRMEFVVGRLYRIEMYNSNGDIFTFDCVSEEMTNGYGDVSNGLSISGNVMTDGQWYVSEAVDVNNTNRNYSNLILSIMGFNTVPIAQYPMEKIVISEIEEVNTKFFELNKTITEDERTYWNNKQDKEDENLNTVDKTIVGAINELELESFKNKAELIALDEYKLEQEDLPCYDSREYKITTLTYDGNAEGKDIRVLETNNGMIGKMVKITDDVSEYDKEGIINGTATIYMRSVDSGEMEDIINIAEFDEVIDFENGIRVADFIIVPFEEVDFATGISLTKGIWFAHMEPGDGSYQVYIKSLTYNKCISGELKKLDEKYLPDDIGEQIDTSDFALKTELHNHTNKAVIDSITQDAIADWNNKLDLEDLPCYDSREIEIKEYTYDGTGTPFEDTVKVSDDVFTLEDIRKGMNFKVVRTYFSDNSSAETNIMKVDESDATLNSVTDDNGVYAVYIANYILIVLRDADGYTTGVYLTHDSNKYISYFSFEKAISGEFKPLDEVYLINKPGKIVKVPCDCEDEDCELAYTGEIFNDVNNNKAGKFSHAEGLNTWALGDISHSEGYVTEALGVASHAEGYQTVASGNKSHAEGCGCVAKAESAHAEGCHTIASSICQHVEGRGNIEDKAQKYLHIVGNGTENARRNAYTLDWSGNAWFAGKATVSVQPTANNDLTTKSYVDNAIAQANETQTSLITQNMNESLDKKQDKVYVDISSEVDKTERSYINNITSSKVLTPNADNYLILNTSINLIPYKTYYMYITYDIVGSMNSIRGRSHTAALINEDDITYVGQDSMLLYDNCTYTDGKLVKNNGTSVLFINEMSKNYAVTAFSIALGGYELLNDDFFLTHRFVTDADNFVSQDYVDNAIAELREEMVTLEEDDLTIDGLVDESFPSLTTEDKTLIGAINEINSENESLQGQINEINSENESLQSQINELFQNVSSGKELIASAITDKGVDASEEETFQSLSEKINLIPSGPPGSNIIGYINEENEIYVSLTELESGTYTLKFEDYAGLLNEFDDIGTVEV